MKKLMVKAKEFIKRNYIACTVILAIVLVVIASLIIIGLIKMNKNTIEVKNTNENMYQYFDREKKEFSAKLSYEDDILVNVKAKDYSIYENSPIYLSKQTGIVMPKESSVVFYYRQNLSYRLPKYSSLTLEDGSSKIKSKENEQKESNFFIYDGLDTYLFPIASTLKVNDTVVNLSKYSYVIANSNYVTYYDYETDSVTKIETVINRAILTINDMSIDLLKDVTVINSKVSLLTTNISSLDIYLED